MLNIYPGLYNVKNTVYSISFKVSKSVITIIYTHSYLYIGESPLRNTYTDLRIRLNRHFLIY